MPGHTAMFSGLSGLAANSQFIDIAGNNISNVNTTAYKSNRVSFETQVSHNLSIGREPNGEFGGANPIQVGLGTRVAGTQRDFGTGSLNPTGDQRDLAIDGDGFFVVERQGNRFFTRDGNFRPNAENVLTTTGGETLMGYGVDEQFNIQGGGLVPVEIPLGTLTIADQTRTVRMSGNLDADGDLPVAGARIDLLGTATNGLASISTAAVTPGAGNRIETGSRLIDIEDPLQPGTDTPLFTDGQTLELRGANKGDGSVLPTESLAITAGTTVQDLMDFLNNTLGIQSTGQPNPNGAVPAVTLNESTGVITIIGNTGEVNDIAIDPTDIRLLSPAGSLVRSPFAVDKMASSSGEAVRTTFVVFDSLGAPVTVDVTMSLESRTSAGTTWRYYAESRDDTDASPALGTGVVEFDTNGNLVTTDPIEVSIDRVNTGAASPLQFELQLTSDADNVTALADVSSQVGATFRDGAPIGTLNDFGVGADGIITGVFSNGLTRTLGQVPVAMFTNEMGMLEVGSNLYEVGANAGQPVITTAGQFGSGPMVGGALELSNVDLGQEFINLILASTGYSASSRVIQTADELMQQLLVLGR